MKATEQVLPGGGASREAIAMAEIGHTNVTRSTARVLTALFLATVMLVPLAEWGAVAERMRDLVRDRAAMLATAPPVSGAWPQLLWRNRIVLEGLSAFERVLEDESLIGRTLRPRAQTLMTRWLAVGNERVYVGRGRWLFYRADVEYVTGVPFLSPAQMRRRVRGAPEWTIPPAADPRPAIIQFERDLAARGIALVVMPTPVKPGVHPEMLGARVAGGPAVVHNASYREWLEGLQASGVRVFDPSGLLAAARVSAPQYLATDSHWTPEAMESIAAAVATIVSPELPARPDPGYRIDRAEVRAVGDTARMLDLPESSPLLRPESAWLRRVLLADGSPWRSSRDADVLLLGDSFSNIYSLESMGWGTSAGLAEHLSLALRRPVDRLVQNDEGAFATRAMVQRDPDRLRGKRVVIYQFAVRELAQGDWKVLPLAP